jgi:DNA-binding CsgD family transcriptional regulator/ArsR family metal-binding transcriptional regulator
MAPDIGWIRFAFGLSIPDPKKDVYAGDGMKSTQNTLHLGYYNIQVCDGGSFYRPGSMSNDDMMASFHFESDISSLFPYINAISETAQLYEKPSMIRFVYQDMICVLYPERCIFSPVRDREHARIFIEELTTYLKQIRAQRETIKPKHTVFQNASVLEILKLLPQSNCQECGFTTCTAFAAMLGQQQTIPARCPHMGPPLAEEVRYPVYDPEGELLSTITLRVDRSRNDILMSSQNDYIRKLEERLSALSEAHQKASKTANDALPTPLTNREIEVLRLVAGGATNTEISRLLHISPHTVKSHVLHIFNKITVNDRTQAAVWAARNNFV